MKNLKVSNKKGFSLVELLVVIAVIGVIAAIAIPAMSSIFGESKTARNKRNAQNVASMANAALAAGVPVGTGGGQIDLTGEDALISSLENGVTVSTGPFVGKTFSVGAIATGDSEVLAELKKHLYITGTTSADYAVNYDANGAH